MAAECLTCQANHDELETPGGVIYQDHFWRLEHACEPLPMVGWLVLKPLRHVETLAELSDKEATSLGPLMRRISRAMAHVLGSTKTYMGLFAEGETARHVHFHLIPRPEDAHPYHRGPTVFERLRVALATGQNLGDPVEAAGVAAAMKAELKP